MHSHSHNLRQYQIGCPREAYPVSYFTGQSIPSSSLLQLRNMKYASQLEELASQGASKYEVSLLAAVDWCTCLDLGGRHSRRADIGNKVRHILVGSDSDNHRPVDLVTCNTSRPLTVIAFPVGSSGQFPTDQPLSGCSRTIASEAVQCSPAIEER